MNAMDAPQYETNHDGNYLFVIHIQGPGKAVINADITISMLGKFSLTLEVNLKKSLFNDVFL